MESRHASTTNHSGQAVPPIRASNRTCGFPASGSRTSVTPSPAQATPDGSAGGGTPPTPPRSAPRDRGTFRLSGPGVVAASTAAPAARHTDPPPGTPSAASPRRRTPPTPAARRCVRLVPAPGLRSTIGPTVDPRTVHGSRRPLHRRVFCSFNVSPICWNPCRVCARTAAAPADPPPRSPRYRSRAVPLPPASESMVIGRGLPGTPAAVPVIQAGQPSQLHVRGLLRLHTCCGPSARYPPDVGLSVSRASTSRFPYWPSRSRRGCPDNSPDRTGTGEPHSACSRRTE